MWAQRFLLEALPSGESLRTELVLRDLARGRYHLEELRLVGSDVLGLFRITRRIGSVGDAERSQREIVIGPAVARWMGGAPELFRRAAREGRGPTRLSGQSNDIRATRPYAPGDDLRHVHWKTTARHNTLVVKEFERATERAPALIVWDGAAYAQWSDGEDSTIEWGLRLAASLHRAFSENGWPCGVLRLDAAPLLLTAVEGTSQNNARVLEMLAVAALRDSSLSQAMQLFLPALPPGLDIYLITASLSPDVARVAHQLRAGEGRVTLGLINGADFQPPAPPVLWRRATGKTPQESWPEGAGAVAGQTPLTIQSYEIQAQRLREQGVATVLLPVSQSDAGAEVRGSEDALRRAMSRMLDAPAARSSAMAAAKLENTAAAST